MPAARELLDLYLHLAMASDLENRPLQRDKFLVLAGQVAEDSGFNQLAEECRACVLIHNPHHRLSNYKTMHDALMSDDFRCYTRKLARDFPFERAEYMLLRYREQGYKLTNHGFQMAHSAEDPSGQNFDMTSPAGSSASPAVPNWDEVPASSPPQSPRFELLKAFSELEAMANMQTPPPVVPTISPRRERVIFVLWTALVLSIGIAIGIIVW